MFWPGCLVNEFSGSSCLYLADTGDPITYHHAQHLHGLWGFEHRLSCLHNKNFIDLSVFPATSLTYTVTPNKLINNSICYRSYKVMHGVRIQNLQSIFRVISPVKSLLGCHNPSVYGSCTTKKVRYSLEHLILSRINMIFLMCFFLFFSCIRGTHIVSTYGILFLHSWRKGDGELEIHTNWNKQFVQIGRHIHAYTYMHTFALLKSGRCY